MSAGGVEGAVALAEFLQAPAATTYLHNDAFPSDHPLWCGPLGYLGHKTAMHALKEADVVIALGTRLGPFGMLPQYYIDYWPKNAKLIQVELDPKRVGRVKALKGDDVGICGDAGMAAQELLQRLQSGSAPACRENQEERLATLKETREAWEAELTAMGDHNAFAAEKEEGRMVPRQVSYMLHCLVLFLWNFSPNKKSSNLPQLFG